MPYTDLPTIYQLRDKAIISYTDFTYANLNSKGKKEHKQIDCSGKFTISAQKRLKKIIDIWTYSLSDINVKYSFYTLTISSKMDEKVNHNNWIKTLIEKLQYRYGSFNYVWKAELQTNGNIHYHGIIDMEIDWKIIRRQWNKIQSVYVDRYQIKMKEKYKNGYYFDTEMKNKKGEIVNDETQYKRWKKGTKANWRNPNSTDVKIIDTETENVNAYVSKYVGKIEEDKENTPEKMIKRWWGSNDELKMIRYAKMSSEHMSIDVQMMINQNTVKVIEENYNIKCKIHEKIEHKIITEIIDNAKQNNKNILIKNADIKSKLIEKEVQQYDKIYGQ